ncbi:MAG TPA: thioredoxin family protein [Anaerolineae bacterium]|nr:thioredoxin family protein [Anaerolineae bacterium]HPL28080.1 thioredoxin family protein [Anaerolineae bacterium]
MAVQNLPQADEHSFDQVVFGEPSPVLVEFFTPWCPHCRRLAPVIEELARDYRDRARFVQVNADQAGGLVVRFQLRGVPTVLVFDQGQEISRLIGAVSKEQLADRLDKALAPEPVSG